ncbi:DsbA family protein [Intrasporangium sp.]|uniref:DsbA family protein n=1 Tax=Intrasporangium sp. TaxID=1925024 RepID=UPI00293A6B2D|nr:thioredoxin domain-containing protein [Intrasporangium sp.]MDV3221372.1 thioredoxin domain-containing protein [Intrasporangium sp.]
MTDTPTPTPDPAAERTPTTSRRQRLVAPLVVTLVAALVTLLVAFGPMLTKGSEAPPAGQAAGTATGDAPGQPAGEPGQPGEPADTSEQDAQIAALATLARRTPGDPVALGAEDAPVVLINYSEYQCPFCGKFARDTKPTLVTEYVDKGLLRIEWRDFPYLGPESTTAAHAGRAAAEQGRFWEFHDAIFADQQPPNSGKLTEGFLAGIAERIGLDVAQFRTDLADPEVQAPVAEDFDEGQSIGVTGTPAFLINGNPVIGAQPTETFTQIIDAELAKAEAATAEAK